MSTDQSHLHPVVTMNLLGDGLHNLIDGMIIGATYMVSIPLGITTTLAVVLHEIPQEIGDFGVLVYGGLSTAKALAFNFLTASMPRPVAATGEAWVLSSGTCTPFLTFKRILSFLTTR